MKAIPKTDYQRCFADWKKRWLKCIAANGDYFEGENLNLHALVNATARRRMRTLTSVEQVLFRSIHAQRLRPSIRPRRTRQVRFDKNKNLKRMSKEKRQAGQKEAELVQKNKSVINAITAMIRRLGRDAPTTAAIFDGSSSVESFLRELNILLRCSSEDVPQPRSNQEDLPPPRLPDASTPKGPTGTISAHNGPPCLDSVPIILNYRHRRCIFVTQETALPSNQKYNPHAINGIIYDYQVKFIKGTKQLEADLLSRNPFCGLLDATQLKMCQNELRDNPKYVHQTSGLTTVTRRGVSKIVVPPSLRPTILRVDHQKFNHPGISQLTRIISTQYFWSGMSIDIHAFVKNCNICQMSKTPKGLKYGELGELPESPLPFDLVSMDTIAGFARYGSAKYYLHVVVDHATRFAWTFPSRSTSTTTYIQVIKRVLQSGCLRRLLTDRAPAFTSPRFRRFLISHNIQPMLTTSNHPQANGLSERLNSTLTGKLRLLHLQHPRASWTMLQSKVVKAYNDTPHSVMGFPPSYLMNGSLPKELSQHLDSYPSVTESRRLALQITKERHKLDKIRFDKIHRSSDFEVGDLVLTKIYQHPNTGKLVPYFSGPYEIIEVISPYTVRINRPNQRTTTARQNYILFTIISHLKYFMMITRIMHLH
ncbi:hypothetical protein LAZ67_12002074 [Cordylochernes scorpioides]|uniref:RNA-directed DNA polymerase n=1 Tax=Cordylochernes scorpioides TaxID=51811 RepID=A0ABY6L214_9ARAC|nr:hypothetical protein LAZ67_12002074 [Cordylochernes scorpioides]